MVSNGPMCEAFRENWAALGQPDWPTVEEDERKTASGGGSTGASSFSFFFSFVFVHWLQRRLCWSHQHDAH